MELPPKFVWPLARLHAEISNSRLLPAPYQRYRQIIADGLDFFLRRLPQRRLSQIFAEQGALPPTVSVEDRLVRLLMHSPVLHKLGQVVARDHRLTPQFRQQLQRLESLSPRELKPEIVQLITRSLQRWRKQEIHLSRVSLAEGSVAVIVPFLWRSPPAKGMRREALLVDSQDRASRPTASPRARRAKSCAGHASSPAPESQYPADRKGVFKVLKPGIQTVLDEDLASLAAFGTFLDERCSKYGLPPLDYRDTFNTIRNLLVHEVRLTEEQDHLVKAQRSFADYPLVRVPALFPFCTASVTAMERIDGTKVADFAPTEPFRREALARLTIEALLLRVLFSATSKTLFHADAHAGNLLVTPDGVLVIIDWSLTGRLTSSERAACLKLLLAAAMLDGPRLAAALRSLCSSVGDQTALQEVAEHGLRQVRSGVIPGVNWAMDLLDQLVIKAGARLGPDLLLFRKNLQHVEGVVTDLVGGSVTRARTLLDQVAIGGFLSRLMAEFPGRILAPYHSREFTTSLSNAELAAWACSAALGPTRWWFQLGRELVSKPVKGCASTDPGRAVRRSPVS